MTFSVEKCNFIQNKCGRSIFRLFQQVTFGECYLVGNTKDKEFYSNTATLYRSFYDGNTTKVTINTPIVSIPKSRTVALRASVHHLVVLTLYETGNVYFTTQP
ncbi:hypothetical protein TVAG_258580 [Trichomonas vaginalis G3]|uniref:Uncharacterized protein n=1 Tax=Trichomonas vaginalis (strain ATCC PRA-98 / G3) TaxID=412133 RepID=A2G773_TRIV3|nr:hypothetical protein TVAG_258580 [Trichomonas vaginalis G3]|eukprot:XP_001299919.1 hypothetical protein [Trichomonas vaginalis G3]